MKPLSPNTLLQNRYLVVHLIGKGGMGEVYLAVDQRLGSAIALKRTFFSDDEHLMTAFEREARTLARLRHPVLPKVSDHFNENDTQYLVMEHISGDDLSKRLESTKKPFPLSWVLFWSDQLLDALAYLHSHEPPIVHRDIKPQNLKLTNENHIILLDFGLAKNSTGQTHFSTGGSIVGYTPHYAPMEQIRGTGTTAKSDIYSLAATLYHLLAAQPPPDALTRADYILNSLADPVQPLSELNPEVPQAISDVILKAMTLSADQRYVSAREMQKALRDAYSEMQNQTQSQTAVLGSAKPEESLPPEPEILQSQMQTEQFNIPSQIPTAEIAVSSAAQFSQKTDVLEKPAEPEIDFEMTLRDGSFSPTALPSTGMKTEILPVNLSEMVEEEKFVEEKKEYNPEVTMPLISFDRSILPDANEPEQTVSVGNSVGETQAVTNFDSIPTEARAVEKTPVYDSSYTNNMKTAAVGQTAAPNNFVPAPPVVKPAQQKGSGGKIAAILGGVGLTTVAAASIGLYAFSDQLGLTAKPTPTPTVQPTITVTPTPAPTVEQTNSNIEVSNQTAEGNTNTNSNTNSTNANVSNKTVTTPTVAPTRSPSAEQTPVKNATPTPRPTQVQTSTPVKPPPTQRPISTPKPPPVKTPVKKPGGRTDIEQ